MLQASYDRVEKALAALRAGNMVLMVDDEARENEADLVVAAEKITAEHVNFMSKFGRGLVCLAMTSEDCERLDLPMMVSQNTAAHRTAFTVSIDSAKQISTGISAFDRAHTMRLAASAASVPEDFARPGHVFPLQAVEGGVFVRAGHTEGSVDLVRLAGLRAAAAICEVMGDDGHMASREAILQLSQQFDLPVLSIEDLLVYRIQHERCIQEVASAQLPLDPHGVFSIRVFRSDVDGAEHVALVSGDLDPEKPSLVRVHSECLTGDAFGSRRCDCGWQLDTALARLGREGGVLLYLRQEGRGIGLANKIKAYALQESGLDTVEANHCLGFVADAREYGTAAQMLRYLGVERLRLMTNNPKKIQSMSRYGFEVVTREPLESEPNQDNVSYLNTKRDKLGHWFGALKE